MTDYKQTEMFPQSSQEDSPAKTSHVRGKPKVSSQNAQGCGQRCFDSSEMYGQRGQLLKMYQPLDLEDLPWSFKISARSGIALNGIAYPLVVPPSVRLTRETGSGSSLIPTPTASTNGPGKNPNNPRGIQQGNALATFARMWPTPTTQDIEHPNAEICPKSGRRFSKDGKSTHSLNLADTARMWPTPCSNTRPNEGNVRLLRAKVMAGELSREEAKAMLNGKDPFEAQGVIPARMWPTPTASDVEGGTAQDVQMQNGSFFRENKKGVRWGVKLRDAVHHTENQLKQNWPTPTARDWKDSGPNLNLYRNRRQDSQLGVVTKRTDPTGGSLNPTWVEWLMGFPSGWTDLSNSETV